MKLITKTGFNFLFLGTFFFLFGLFIFYIVIRTSVQNNIESELFFLKDRIIRMHTNNESYRDSINEFQILVFNKKVSPDLHIDKSFSDTVLYNKYDGKYLMFRQLKFTMQFQNHNYLFQLFKPYGHTDKLLISILLFSSLMILIFIVGMFLLSRYTLRKSWATFYRTIFKLNHFDVNSKQKFVPEQTDVDEFESLNNAILKMIEKINYDFKNLKEYTENTSHEMQTPLAIINSKIEMLLQL